MNKYQEALNKLLKIAGESPNAYNIKSEYELLKELVNKEKPKKLKQGKNHKHDCLDVVCPNCEAEFEAVIRKCGWGNDYQTLQRCSHCGQMLEQEWL